MVDEGDIVKSESIISRAVMSVSQELDGICARVLIDTLNSATWSSAAAMHTQHPSWVTNGTSGIGHRRPDASAHDGQNRARIKHITVPSE
jgi:hypothetical protein